MSLTRTSTDTLALVCSYLHPCVFRALHVATCGRTSWQRWCVDAVRHKSFDKVSVLAALVHECRPLLRELWLNRSNGEGFFYSYNHIELVFSTDILLCVLELETLRIRDYFSVQSLVRYCIRHKQYTVLCHLPREHRILKHAFENAFEHYDTDALDCIHLQCGWTFWRRLRSPRSHWTNKVMKYYDGEPYHRVDQIKVLRWLQKHNLHTRCVQSYWNEGQRQLYRESLMTSVHTMRLRAHGE